METVRHSMETIRCKQQNVLISKHNTPNPCEIEASAAADRASILGCYAAYVGGYWQTFRCSLSAPSSRAFLDCVTLENGKDGLSRNVGKKTTTMRCVTTKKSEDILKQRKYNLL